MMLVLLAIYAAALVASSYAAAWAIVAILDRLGLCYNPGREDGKVSFPAELLEHPRGNR